jgi:cytoskeletal protein RodZ
MSARSRDAALRRLSLLNRWLAVAAVVLTIAVGVVVANAFRGHSIARAATRTPLAQAGRRSRHRHHKQQYPNPFPDDSSATSSQSTPPQSSQSPSTPAPTTQAPSTPAPAPAPTPAPVQSPAPVVSGGS